MNLPATLYKYQPFGPHTGLNLTLLLKHQTIFFPRKHALNDPTDCEPNLVFGSGKNDLLKALQDIQDAPSPPDVFKEEAKLISASMHDSQGDAPPSKETGFNTILSGLLNQTPEEKASSLIRSVMRFEIGTPRIFSMSSSWNVGQMWSHYADSHRGYCLSLSGIATAQSHITIQKVTYTTERPQIFLDEVLSLPSESTKSAATIQKLYCVKSDAWKHEDEYRLVARDRASVSDACFLSIPDGDFYKLSGLKLEAIYIGQNCSVESKWKVKDLVTSIVSKEDRPRMFQISQSAESYDLVGREDSYERFPAYSLPPTSAPIAAKKGGGLASWLALALEGDPK